jgi:hypothetical protein
MYLCGLLLRVLGYISIDPGFDTLRYKIFREVVGLEWGPLSLVSTIEELLGRNSSGSGIETQEYGRGDPSRRARDSIYPQTLALTSPTGGGHSVGIVRLRNKAAEFSSVYVSATYKKLSMFLRRKIFLRDGPFFDFKPAV